MAKRGKLRVPVFSQPVGTGWCMPAAVRMVMAYHGDLVPIEDIAKGMGASRNDGTDSMSAATYLLRRGYAVRIVGWCPEYPPSFSSLKGPITKERFMRWARRKVDDPSAFRKACRKLGREFFESGGEIEPRPAGTKEIRAALKRGQPPVVFINVTTLWQANREGMVHAVVPLETNNVSVVIIDPAPNKGRSTYTLTSFLHAFYRGEGEVMFIKPRP